MVQTDTLARVETRRREVMEQVLADGRDPDLGSLKLVAASSDIHEYGLHVVVSVLRELGCDVVDLGTSVDNEIIAAAAAETAADAVALSTYNGGALTVTEDLIGRLRARELGCQLFVGGRLTQDG